MRTSYITPGVRLFVLTNCSSILSIWLLKKSINIFEIVGLICIAETKLIWWEPYTIGILKYDVCTQFSWCTWISSKVSMPLGSRISQYNHLSTWHFGLELCRDRYHSTWDTSARYFQEVSSFFRNEEIFYLVKWIRHTRCVWIRIYLAHHASTVNIV